MLQNVGKVAQPLILLSSRAFVYARLYILFTEYFNRKPYLCFYAFLSHSKVTDMHISNGNDFL